MYVLCYVYNNSASCVTLGSLAMTGNRLTQPSHHTELLKGRIKAQMHIISTVPPKAMHAIVANLVIFRTLFYLMEIITATRALKAKYLKDIRCGVRITQVTS